MVKNAILTLNGLFRFVNDNVEIFYTQKNRIDYYLIITPKVHNIIISYEFIDNMWNLYLTKNKSKSLESINYEDLIPLSGAKSFYRRQDLFVIKKVGVLKFLFESNENYLPYLEYFAFYIKTHYHDL